MASKPEDRRAHLASLRRGAVETSIRYETIARQLDIIAERGGDKYYEIEKRAEFFEESAKILGRMGNKVQAKANFAEASYRRETHAAKLLESKDSRHAAYEFAKAAEDAELARDTSRKRYLSTKAAQNYIVARDNAVSFDDKALFGILAANNMSRAGVFSIWEENVREVHARAVSDYESSSKQTIVRVLINRSPLSRGRLF